MYIWVPSSVGHSPISSLDGFSSAMRVFYLINIIIIIIIIIYYIIFLKFNWGIRIWPWVFIVCMPYLSYGFCSDLLYYYLSGLLEILIGPKSFLLWPLVGTEKVGSSHLAPGWYRESPICYYIIFFIRIW
jgi:hypothetical protein